MKRAIKDNCTEISSPIESKIGKERRRREGERERMQEERERQTGRRKT